MSDLRLPSRNDLRQKFSSFAFIGETGLGGSRWVSDRALEANFRCLQQQSMEFHRWCESKDEKAIVEYFLKLWNCEDSPPPVRQLARQHIAAYLESPRYRAVTNRYHAFRNPNFPQETRDRLLYISGCLTSDTDKICQFYQRYQPDSSYSLEKHFQLELASQIREVFHAQTGQGKYSQWYALKSASDRKLQRGLTSFGITNPSLLDSCLHARACLFQVYSKSGKEWREPKPQHYQEAANYYNRHYLEQTEKGDRHPVTAEKFESWIRTCVNALQASPKICYFDSYENPSQLENLSLTENLLSQEPLEAIEEESFSKELEKYLAYFTKIMLESLQKIEAMPKNRVILFLRYGFGLSGKRIGQKISLHQSNVSRCYKKCQRDLLQGIAEWVKTDLQMDLKKVSELEEYVVAWLQQHYQTQLDPVLKTGWHKLGDRNQIALTQLYGQEIEVEDIAEELNETPHLAKKRIKNACSQLKDAVIAWIQVNLEVSLEPERKKVGEFVEKWLHRFYDRSFK
ncbi:hypothetical protein [Phormidium sp. CCY1219]|uniref:hypothetical protein n=1 Tax=Phormidium sp. CCY1219 TaxID=2886104 RepID=UPI002D1ECDA2|nr:hypothetical protein [Phormidium sp. CCY1219]MEB3829442.1 hypothetical protein [Phormidium sp. CCY1219]